MKCHKRLGLYGHHGHHGRTGFGPGHHGHPGFGPGHHGHPGFGPSHYGPGGFEPGRHGPGGFGPGHCGPLGFGPHHGVPHGSGHHKDHLGHGKHCQGSRDHGPDPRDFFMWPFEARFGFEKFGHRGHKKWHHDWRKRKFCTENCDSQACGPCQCNDAVERAELLSIIEALAFRATTPDATEQPSAPKEDVQLSPDVQQPVEAEPMASTSTKEKQ